MHLSCHWWRKSTKLKMPQSLSRFRTSKLFKYTQCYRQSRFSPAFPILHITMSQLTRYNTSLFRIIESNRPTSNDIWRDHRDLNRHQRGNIVERRGYLTRLQRLNLIVSILHRKPFIEEVLSSRGRCIGERSDTEGLLLWLCFFHFRGDLTFSSFFDCRDSPLPVQNERAYLSIGTQWAVWG